MLIRVLTAVVLAAPPAHAPSDPPVTGSTTVDAAAVDAVLRGYLDATGVPGAAVAVTHGRTVVRTAGYGRTCSTRSA